MAMTLVAVALPAPSRNTEETPPRQRGVMRRGAGTRDRNTDIAGFLEEL